MWIINERGLTNTKFPDFTNITPLSAPYPNGLWRFENGKLTNKVIPEKEIIGAFANAVNLRKVYIPPTVKKIGKYSFRNTKLTSVTIAKDCEYYPTSFPDNCTVNFYP